MLIILLVLVLEIYNILSGNNAGIYASIINEDSNEGEYVFLTDNIDNAIKESDFSPLNTYKKLFEMLEVDFEFNDDFIEYITKLAIAKQSGARSLKTVFDDCISSALFRIFAGEYSGISLIKPDDKNNKPYVLTKTKDKKHGLFEKNNKKAIRY